MNKFSAVKNILVEGGVEAAKVDETALRITALSQKNYGIAIMLLGAVTILLALGAVLLPAFDKEVAEALWGALGAGIGGLAGIFMAQD